MKFSKDKCEGGAPAAVQVGSGWQETSSEEGDWGVQAGRQLGMGHQCAWQQQKLTATWAVLQAAQPAGPEK